MANFGFLSGKDELAVDNLISQATDLYVLEQVAAINCSAFTDSALPTNLESRFRRLKSLPGSRPDPVSSSKKSLSHSKSLSVRPEKDPRNASSASTFKPDPIAKPGGDFSDSGKIGSGSSKFSLKLPKEKLRISSSSFTSIDLSSPSSSKLEQEERSNRKSKSKSKFSLSWFGKLSSPSQAMGCLYRSPSKSSSINKKTMKSSSNKSFTTFPKRDKDVDFDEFLSDFGELSVEEKKKLLKNAIKESQRMRREAAEIIKTGK